MRNCESYAHKFAKQTLADWFKEKWLINRDKNIPNSYFIFDWNPNISDGNHGVYFEYPVIERTLSSGQKEILGLSPVWDQIPDLTALTADKQIMSVFDIVVCDSDRVRYAFEINHKHPCSTRKIKLLKEFSQKYGLEVYEIDASWILNQVKRPNKLEMLKLT